MTSHDFNVYVELFGSTGKPSKKGLYTTKGGLATIVRYNYKITTSNDYADTGYLNFKTVLIAGGAGGTSSESGKPNGGKGGDGIELKIEDY